MKNYYISGVAKDVDYEESFERIIESESKKKAHIELMSSLFGFSIIEIDQFYETTSEARL